MKFVTDFNKEAVFYKNKEYSYKDIIRTAKYFSSLIEMKKNEDKAVIFMENRPEFICSFFGIWNSRGIPVNIDAGYTCLLYTSPSPRDGLLSRMPSSA